MSGKVLFRSNNSKSRGTRTRGFTIVELLVVIVVIGILAGLGLVAYNGIQQRGQESALRNDISQASKLLEFETRNMKPYPSNYSVVDGGKGLPSSDGKTSWQYTTDGSSYCLTGIRNFPGVPALHVTSDTNGIQDGPCPGHNGPLTGNEGVVWNPQTAPSGWWRSVTYGNGLFVAVANGGTNRVMTSSDGTGWTARTAPLSAWQGVTYGNGRFVAVGNNVAMTSTDGITWSPQTAPSGSWQSVTYGNSLFVAVSSAGGTSRVMTSPDGINWTARSPYSFNSGLRSVTYGNGRFIAVSENGPTARGIISTDGITWNEFSESSIEGGGWLSVTYGNGRFVAVKGTGASAVMSSTNDTSWSLGTPPNSNEWYSVTYGGGLFVAAGSSVMTSSDGTSWTARTTPSGGWLSVTYGNGRFVAVKNGSTNSVIVSP